jgi:hypothetical protein
MTECFTGCTVTEILWPLNSCIYPSKLHAYVRLYFMIVTLTALKVTILLPGIHYLAYISFEKMYDAEYYFGSSLMRDNPSIFQQTHSDQYLSKFLLNNVQIISLNIKSYL